MKSVVSFTLSAFCIFVLLLASACSKDEQPKQNVSVRVEHLKTQKTMRVTWSFAQPVKALVFSRPGLFRSKDWVPETPSVSQSFKILSAGQHEYVVAENLTRDFVLNISERSIGSLSDYPFIREFSDGGIVVYTGHLQAVAINCEASCTAAEVEAKRSGAALMSFQFIPAAGERLIIKGAATQVATAFNDELSGQFVYLGMAAPADKHTLSMVIDPAIPAWVRSEIESKLPSILNHMTHRLALPLPFRPIVYVPFRKELERSTGSYSGAVAASNMLLSFTGDRWSRPAIKDREDLLKLLAHESFHFWNASLYHSVETDGGRWLHEGGADAVAYLTLLELGYISRERYGELQNEALNRCMIGLTEASLPQSNSRSSIRNHYDCGATIELAVQAAITPSQKSLWTFWSDLLSNSKGTFYTHQNFFELIDKMTGATHLSVNLKTLSNGQVRGTYSGSPTVEKFFLQLFDSVGTNSSMPVEAWPQWYHQILGEKAMTSIETADCGDAGSFESLTEAGAYVLGSTNCRALVRPMLIKKVGEFDIFQQAVQAYDQIRLQCASGGRVGLQLAPQHGENSKVVEAACPRLPTRPNYIEVTGGIGI